jgi:hypothetical protein
MFCSNAYDAASRDSVILSFWWPSQLNHNLGLFSLDHRWFSGKITITKAAMAGWLAGSGSSESLTAVQHMWADHCFVHVTLSSTLQRRRWAFLLIAMPEIYNRLTGYTGIKVPAIPNLESNFFYHFLHTHRPNLSLSLSPHISYLFVGIFPEKELIESCNFCFAKYFEGVPPGRGNLLHYNCICSSNQPSQKNIKRS